MKKEKRIGYMCATDFDYHIGEDKNPSEIYSSEKLLRQARKCVKQCGVVKVQVTIVKRKKGNRDV